MGFPLLIQAPLSGYTDSPFRRIVKEYGADVVYSEMISSIGIVKHQKKSISLGYFKEEERPIFLQIFGESPEIMGNAAVILVEKFSPDGIDINMGCPVKKVVKSGGGSALLKDLSLIRKIVKRVRDVVKCSLSVKIRSGWDEDESLKIAKVIEDAGADILVIHPRTRQQFFSGNADWEIVKRIKSNISIKVIGNGDIRLDSQAKELYEYTGVDGIMIGRESLEKPYIFSSIKYYFENGIERYISDEEMFDIIKKYIDYECSYRGEERALQFIRKELIHLLKGRKNSHKIKNKIFRVDNKIELLKMLREEFSDDRIISSLIRS